MKYNTWAYEQALTQDGRAIPYNWHILEATKPAPGVDKTWSVVAETTNEQRAKLIAAAPDMLKALEAIEQAYSDSDELWDEVGKRIEATRAIIAKAKGE